MGRYDDILAGLPPAQGVSSGGKYDDLVSDLPAEEMGGSPPLSFVASQIMKMQPTEKISQGLKTLAGNTAEKMGSMGIPPKVAATTMLPLAIAPELVAAGSALGLLEGPSRLAKAIRNTPSNLGPQYEFQNAKAGIGTLKPVRRGLEPTFNLPKGRIPAVTDVPKTYPQSPEAFYNYADTKLKTFGDQLSTQELNHWKKIIGKFLDKGPNRIGSDMYGSLSKLKDQVSSTEASAVTKALKGVDIPKGFESTREELNAINRLSRQLRIAPEIAKKVWKYLGPKLRWGLINVP